MCHRLKPTLAVWLCTITALAPSPSRAQAVAEPAARAVSDVRDDAGLFSRDAITKAKQRLAEIERTHHVPAVIETVDSLSGSPIEAAAAERARKTGAEIR